MERGIVLVGLNHRTAPVEVRERVAFANGRLEPSRRRLVAVAGGAEGAILSTCNRVEVVACGPDPAALGAALPGFLAGEHGAPEPALAGHLYTHGDREAVRHLFRVAASLDSMVVGEPQIVGQMKEQYAAAAAAGASGQILHRCFHRSFSVAKRIRRETGIAERAVSIGSAAVELSRGIFDRLVDKSALLLGAGMMGELTARQLLAQGVGSVMVANRTFDRAIDVARALSAMPVPWDRLARYLPLADLVIAAASGEDFLLQRPAVEEAMRERRHRPMFLIDLAVPRALDPAVNQLDNVYLYDIDDLEGVVAQNRGARAREAVKAETIVDAEVEAFWRWFTSLDVVPTIVELREHRTGPRKILTRTHSGVLRLGTRGSALARAQAALVHDALVKRHPGLRVETVFIRTSGDRAERGRETPAGLKGLFVKEIEEALLAGEIDVGVHSMKDLPARLPARLVVGAVPARAPAHDVLIGAAGLRDLPPGARVGTASVRRRAQLLARRPDLAVTPLRGNIDTRLRRWREGAVDALVLAAAGLERLGITEPAAHALVPEEFLPPVGQGALALECRADATATRALLAAVEDPAAATAVAAERAFLLAIGGDCNTPLAAHATVADGRLTLRALVTDLEGRRWLEQADSAPAANAEAPRRARAGRL